MVGLGHKVQIQREPRSGGTWVPREAWEPGLPHCRLFVRVLSKLRVRKILFNVQAVVLHFVQILRCNPSFVAMSLGQFFQVPKELQLFRQPRLAGSDRRVAIARASRQIVLGLLQSSERGEQLRLCG